MSIMFPRTAVIYPGCKDEALVLMEFLAENGFKWDDDQDLIEHLDSCWEDDDTCFDIETEKLSVCGCQKGYYKEEFSVDFPELVPEDEFFLCSVNDFIVRCGGQDRFPDFETANSSEIEELLFG